MNSSLWYGIIHSSVIDQYAEEYAPTPVTVVLDQKCTYVERHRTFHRWTEAHFYVAYLIKIQQQ